jgi:hypothetical protein
MRDIHSHEGLEPSYRCAHRTLPLSYFPGVWGLLSAPLPLVLLLMVSVGVGAAGAEVGKSSVCAIVPVFAVLAVAYRAAAMRAGEVVIVAAAVAVLVHLGAGGADAGQIAQDVEDCAGAFASFGAGAENGGFHGVLVGNVGPVLVGRPLGGLVACTAVEVAQAHFVLVAGFGLVVVWLCVPVYLAWPVVVGVELYFLRFLGGAVPARDAA